MSINKFNKPVFTFKADDDFEYKDLKTLYKENGKEEIYRIRALYVNTKSKFGDSPVAITDAFYINLPKHLLNVVNEIISDANLVQDINDGLVAIEIYEYIQREFNRKCYSINWVDLKSNYTASDDDLPF